ncbi:MAG: NAD-dependent epimerase/dehydratase family protein, partial [Myxococcota bacterium]|nr:NAD-dependent epimerase/dehydratase family protein [Myxococcota bacterium]
MRVLVTGGTGFVGSHTVRALQEAGHAVRLLVRSPEKVRRVFGDEASRLGVTQGDVVREDDVARALRGCDAVVHAAAMVSLRASEAAKVHAVNVRGTGHVVGGAARRGIPRILYVSSASALAEPGGPTVTAASPVVPARSAYGRSKAETERMVRQLQAEGAPVAITHPAGVVGPDDPGLSEANHALWTFVHDVTIHTQGVFQAVDVRDVAALHVRLLEGDTKGRWPAASRSVPWGEMADLLDGLTGVRVRRLRVPGVVLRAAGRVGDVAKRFVDFSFPLTTEAMDYATRWPGVDASATTHASGVTFRPPESTFADALRWMHAAGHLEARHVGRLALGHALRAGQGPGGRARAVRAVVGLELPGAGEGAGVDGVRLEPVVAGEDAAQRVRHRLGV